MIKKTNIFALTRVMSRGFSSIPPTDYKPKPYTGPSKEEVKKLRKSHLFDSIFLYYSDPLMITDGYMQYMFDE